MRFSSMLSIVAALSVALLPSLASASGLFVARFGGEHGHATTDNPTAIYYNPAGLALGEGTQLLIDATLAQRSASFTRPASALSPDGSGTGGSTPADGLTANAGEATLTNQAAAPFLGVRSDLGIPNLGVGAAFFVPIGGAATWDGNDAFAGNAAYPGAEDGIARWWAMEGALTSMYLALGAAYRLPDLGLSLGLALNGVRTKVHTIRGRNTDGTDLLLDKDGGLKEGRTELNASGTDLALGLGVIYEPADDLWVGVSFQTRPGLTGDQTLEGDLRQALGTAPTNESKIELVQGLADNLKVGYRQRFGERWEARAQLEMAFWSAMKRQCVLRVADGRKCVVDEETGRTEGEHQFEANFERHWEDAFGGRAGVSYFVHEGLEMFGGAGYDASAIPAAYMDPALFDLEKYTASLGARFSLGESLDLTATFTQVIYMEQDTAGQHRPPTLQPQSNGPDAGGVYKQAISVLNIGLLAKL